MEEKLPPSLKTKDQFFMRVLSQRVATVRELLTMRFEGPSFIGTLEETLRDLETSALMEIYDEYEGLEPVETISYAQVNQALDPVGNETPSAGATVEESESSSDAEQSIN